jgi:hypothetical protein
MGRIFAQLAIVYIERFCKNYRSGTKFWATFFLSIDYVENFNEVLVGLHFGRFFSQSHLVAQLEKFLFTKQLIRVCATPTPLFFVASRRRR